MPPYDMIADRGGTAWFPPDRPPALALFVSHRWLSPGHPDPNGDQLRSLQRLLGAIVAVATGMRHRVKNRVEILPTLMRHGPVHAAFLLGAAANSEGAPLWQSWSDLWRKLQDYNNDSLARGLLEHIGFWYDYSCLPQAMFANVRNHKAHEFSERQVALFKLHELAASCPMLILRMRDDDYERRAWCSAELAMGPPVPCHLVLRTDLLGEPIRREEFLSPSANKPNVWPGRQLLIDRITEWETGIDPLSKRTTRELWNPWWIFCHWRDLAELEERRTVPLLTTPRSPNIFAGQKKFLSTMMDAMGNCSRQDFGGLPLKDCDLGQLVAHAMDMADLRSSEPADLVFVGLTILHARHAAAPEFAQFYAEARRRLLEGQPLQLSRYRERRGVTVRSDGQVLGNLDVAHVWHVFEDEDASMKPIPKWARD